MSAHEDVSGSIFGFRVTYSRTTGDGIVFKMSGNSRNSGLIIYSQLVLVFPVVTVNATVSVLQQHCACRAWRQRAGAVSFHFPWPCLGNCGCFASMATSVIFRGRRMLPEKVEAEASRGVVERQQTKPSHLLLQSGHHVHDDNWQFSGAKAFLGTRHLLMTTACLFKCFKEAIKSQCVSSVEPHWAQISTFYSNRSCWNVSHLPCVR